jgi:hypothetical protein
MGEMRDAYKGLIGNFKESNQWREISVDGRIILKYIANE